MISTVIGASFSGPLLQDDPHLARGLDPGRRHVDRHVAAAELEHQRAEGGPVRHESFAFLGLAPSPAALLVLVVDEEAAHVVLPHPPVLAARHVHDPGPVVPVIEGIPVARVFRVPVRPVSLHVSDGRRDQGILGESAELERERPHPGPGA